MFPQEGTLMNQLVEQKFLKTRKSFLIILGALSTLGVVMVLSSSYLFAKDTFGNSFYFFYRQLFFLFLGIGVAFFIAKTRPSFWMKYAGILNIISCLLLILTFIPGLNVLIKGAHRWISVAGITVQPGEFAKYSFLLGSLSFFENFERLSPKKRIFSLVPLLLILVLLLLQPDFGTFFICCVIMIATCYLSRFPRKYFYWGLSVMMAIGPIILLAKPYRVNRLMAFLDPWKNPRGTGFQIIQSYLAFANGSWFGQGLGNSNEKLFYLPEAHNDFIFSVLGEEMGLFGVLLLVLLFMGFIYFGLKMASRISHRTGVLIISSVVITIGVQAFLNMGVVLGLLPTKGLNLPFISYGGSSLVSNFFGIGLILAVTRFVSKGQYSLRI